MSDFHHQWPWCPTISPKTKSITRSLVVSANDTHTQELRNFLEGTVTRGVTSNKLNFGKSELPTHTIVGRSYDLSKQISFLNQLDNTIPCLPVFETSPEGLCAIDNKLGTFLWPQVWLILLKIHLIIVLSCLCPLISQFFLKCLQLYNNIISRWVFSYII